MGRNAGDVERLLAEFKRAGEVVQHGTFGAPHGCNWLYLQYEVPPPPLFAPRPAGLVV